jgi:hypothetical protein
MANRWVYMFRSTISALIIFFPLLTQAGEQVGGGTGWYVNPNGSDVFRLPGPGIGVRNQLPAPSVPPAPMLDIEEIRRQRMELELYKKRMEEERRRRMQQEQQRRQDMEKEKVYRLPQPGIGIRKKPQQSGESLE